MEVALPSLTDENNGASIHAFSGLKSNNNAAYGSTINTDENGNISIKLYGENDDITPTNNQYHFANRPIINYKANDQSKIYGDSININNQDSTEIADFSFSDITITTDLIDADDFGGVFTQDTVSSSIKHNALVLNTVVHGEQNVGGHNITPSGLTSPNGYDFTYSTGVLTVNVRPITLTAKAQTKTYGDTLEIDDLDKATYADDPFTIADKGVSGDSTLPNSELINKVNLVSADYESPQTNAGTYEDKISIDSISDSSPGFNLANYDITYATGDLTVNVRPITLTAKPQTKTYGDELILDALDADTYADDPFTIADKGVSGDSTLPNGEAINKVLFNSITNKNTSTVAAADTYDNEIQITSISDSSISASNYNITYAPGDLTIAPRAITLTASDRTKVYGDELVLGNTSFTIADEGVSGDTTLPNGETVDTVNLVSGSTVTSVNDAGENVTEDLGVSLSASTDLDEGTVHMKIIFRLLRYRIVRTDLTRGTIPLLTQQVI